MASNKSLIQKGFDILHPYLAGYLCQELNTAYDGNYWWSAVRQKLDDRLEDLPTSGTYAELMDSLDIANCLRILDRFRNEIFKKKLAIDYHTWSKELMGVRHKIAHADSADFDGNYTWRALDTMTLLCAAFDDESAEEIREIQRVLRYGSSNGSTSATTTEQTAGTSRATGISKRRRAVFRVGDKSWSLTPMLHRDAISTLNLLLTSHRLHEVRVRLNTVIRLNFSLVHMSLTVWRGCLFRHCSALPARAENLLSS